MLAGSSVVVGVDVGNFVVEDRLNSSHGFPCLFQRITNPSLTPEDEPSGSSSGVSSGSRADAPLARGTSGGGMFAEFGVDAPGGAGVVASTRVATGPVTPGNWIGSMNSVVQPNAVLSVRLATNPLDTPGTKLRVNARASSAMVVAPVDLLQPLFTFVGPIRPEQVAPIKAAIMRQVGSAVAC